MGSMSCREKSATLAPNDENDEFVEAVVADSADLAEGQMKEVSIAEDGKVLVARLKGGAVTAIGAKCSHYGAPLVKGAMGDNRVRCPWHGACFNLTTGDIEDFPGLDGVACHEAREVGGKIMVRARKSQLQSHKRTCNMVARDEANTQTALVIGGGAAGATCIESLRQNGFTGRIMLLCAENFLPYDRPKLSKALDADPAKIALRDAEFYQKNGIEVHLGAEVNSIDPGRKLVSLEQGEELSYDGIVIATGSEARGVDGIEGCDLKNIFTLRTVQDANEIATVAKGKKVVIIGNSFIGMEVAAYMKGKALTVTIVGRSAVPLEPVLGSEIGAAVLKLFTDNEIVHLGGRSVSSFVGSEGAVSGVKLDDGQTLDAELVVAGIGATPNSKFLTSSGVRLDSRGFVVVDQNLRTNLDGVFAAGDVTAAPLSLNGRALPEPVNIGHWQLSHFHGKIAGRNLAALLAGRPQEFTPLDAVPFFWTMLFGKSIRYAGYGHGFEEIHMVGDPSALQFEAYYLKGGEAVAIATLNADPVAAQFAEHLAAKRPALSKERLLADHTYWRK
ncbi:apoptosis-inducing factor 3 isoform X2 [Neocloeon triangulifer]|nr:apoptosis-inducing factor 3 isoform X2 [Neocloeon triangulifer]